MSDRKRSMAIDWKAAQVACKWVAGVVGLVVLVFAYAAFAAYLGASGNPWILCAFLIVPPLAFLGLFIYSQEKRDNDRKRD